MKRSFDQSGIKLAAFNEFLTSTHDLWHFRPFYREALPWMEQMPELAQRLLELDSASFHRLAYERGYNLTWFSTYLPELVEQIARFESIDALPSRPLKVGKFDDVGIPGRKWQQIIAFIEALPEANQYLEWCSGKGSLAQTLIANRESCNRIDCLEINSGLVEAGEKRCTSRDLNVHFHCCDVLGTLPSLPYGSGTLHYALHACGDLHRRFLEENVSQGYANIALAPCCFHKIKAKQYAALSSFGKALPIVIDQNDLKLAQEFLVTGGARDNRLRIKEQIWRLAYEKWRLQADKSANYRPLPSIAKSRLSEDFTSFGKWAAAYHGLSWDGQESESELLKAAKAERERICRLDLVRHLFRRVLEHWLLLDKVVFLREQGYEVSYGTFCDYELTPRNLMILARLVG